MRGFDLPQTIVRRRDDAADAELARYDFGEFVTVERIGSGWQHDEPERWYCVVRGTFRYGAPQRCQFNVWFERDSARVVDVYEGDWH